MEILDIYDIDRQRTQKTAVRWRLNDGEYHLGCHVCLFNSDGKMLIQQRSKDKKGWANLWYFTAGGSALSLENSRQAIARELKEEVGIDYDFSNMRCSLTVPFPEGFDDIYLIEKSDIDISTLKLQREEVQAVKWASEEEILKMIDGGEFIPYYKEMISLMFKMRFSLGMVDMNHRTSIKNFEKE